MSMQHHAFLFDFDAYNNSLKTILEQALQSGSTQDLLHFIEQKRDGLKDPYEGDALPTDWRSFVDVDDVHQLGDVALTAFYSPTADRGFGQDWETLASMLEPIAATLGFSPVLGRTIGPPDNPFDPGKMGSYFLSEDDVDRASKAIAAAPATESIRSLAKLFDTARSAGRVLYVTF